jgi:hypothetical protein
MFHAKKQCLKPQNKVAAPKNNVSGRETLFHRLFQYFKGRRPVSSHPGVNGGDGERIKGRRLSKSRRD